MATTLVPDITQGGRVLVATAGRRTEPWAQRRPHECVGFACLSPAHGAGAGPQTCSIGEGQERSLVCWAARATVVCHSSPPLPWWQATRKQTHSVFRDNFVYGKGGSGQIWFPDIVGPGLWPAWCQAKENILGMHWYF